jgi:hypoxanthine phosphoribosyltransferase
MAERVKVLLTEEEVDKRIRELGEQITKDYEGRTVRLVCILRGAVFFMCELAKRIELPVRFDFMSVSSYGSGTSSSGIVRIIKDLEDPVTDEDVIIVEDIIDSGRTLSFLKELFKSRGAASIRVCTLLDKPSRRAPGIDIKVDYTGFQVPDKFVVGWGMDYDQRYRNLPYIGVITGLDEE